MAKAKEFTYGDSAERVFSAYKQAIAALGYTVIYFDEAGKLISFNTGRSVRSWAGQDMQVTVFKGRRVLGEATESGATALVGGSMARRGGFSTTQSVGWGELSALTQKLVARVEDILPRIPEPTPAAESPTAFEAELSVAAGTIATSTVDRLDAVARAAELRDKGTLTEEEFQKEKSRILGS